MAKLFNLNRFKPGPPLHRRAAASPPTCIEEEYYLESRPVPLVWNRQPQTENDEVYFPPIGTSAGAVRMLIMPAVRPVEPITDTDELSFSVALDDDAVPVANAPRAERNRQLVFDTDEQAPPPSVGLDDEPFTVGKAAGTIQNRQLSFDTDEDHASPLGGLRIDEEYEVSRRQIPLVRNAQPLLDLDELGQAVTFTGNPGGCVRIIVVPTVRVVHPITDTDEIGFTAAPFGLDEDYHQPATWRGPRVPLSAESSQDELGFTVSPFGLDEDGVIVWPMSSATIRPRVLLGDDAITPLHDESDWERPRYISYVVNRQQTFETDELAFTVAPFGLDEDYHQPTSWRGSRIPLSAENVQDELGFPPPVFGLDEDYHQPATWCGSRIPLTAECYQDELGIAPPVTFMQAIGLVGSIPTGRGIIGAFPSGLGQSAGIPTGRQIVGDL